METGPEEQRQVAVRIAQGVGEEGRAALLAWAQGLLAIRNSSRNAAEKSVEALALTLKSNVVWPMVKELGKEIKQRAWDDRNYTEEVGPVLTRFAREIKAKAWDERNYAEEILPATKALVSSLSNLWGQRSLATKVTVATASLAAAAFGSQGAGIAALGGAIGVPLWVVLGAGGMFIGVLIEELKKAGSKPAETTYTIVTAKKEDPPA